ncbi:MAG: aminotransferase class V-fold PLP-dependent enzyme [Phenylobacterium sp.]|uniref:aminotransferase class V-fold PLP-dependent enzyme n=1 Tax=Phenylobacterium sp. TaxID=1871053 RepID=UPI001A22CCB0|nr:aminotransferase class V-fold PLP-dependent enzyme [Phenylobacterium sp.]MBJ7410326.1 aminotransferase class V-fold PLP-dependent enzyme [Phenylobacterium sp.]
MDLSRRAILAAGAAAPAGGALTAEVRAADEAHWGKVAALYDAPPPGVIQLENGYFGAMARSTRAAYERHTARVNRETSIYARDAFNADMAAVRARCGKLLQVDPDEIAFTRGGTESMVTLIGGYNRLKPGDAVLYADLDYDSMKTSMAALGKLRGVRVVRIDLPEPADRQNVIDAYEAALKANPDVRMMLLTHLSNRTGLIPPVKEIVALARARGVDVLLDSGHALGQTEFTLRDLGVEFAGFGLHKWIGAPVGVGLVYIHKDRIPDIDVSILEGPSPRIDARVHTGTLNFAAVLAVPDAIDAHEAVGLPAKARRLRYLRDRWAEAVRDDPRIQVLTPNDPALHAGITSFRIAGRTSREDNLALKKLLFDRHRIFTVERVGVAKGACIRISPSFVNTPAQMDALAAALREIARG